MRPLIDFLSGVLSRPDELAAFREAPAGFLALHGYEGIDDEDAVEALSLVADTMPAAVAAGLVSEDDWSAADRMGPSHDVRAGFDDLPDHGDGAGAIGQVAEPEAAGESSQVTLGSPDVGGGGDLWAFAAPHPDGPEMADTHLGLDPWAGHPDPNHFDAVGDDPLSGGHDLDDPLAADPFDEGDGPHLGLPHDPGGTTDHFPDGPGLDGDDVGAGYAGHGDIGLF